MGVPGIVLYFRYEFKMCGLATVTWAPATADNTPSRHLSGKMPKFGGRFLGKFDTDGGPHDLMAAAFQSVHAGPSDSWVALDYYKHCDLIESLQYIVKNQLRAPAL